MKLHLAKASGVMAWPIFDSLCSRQTVRIGTLLSIYLLSFTPARAELSQKEARKAITKAAGLALPSRDVHIERIVSSSAASAEVTTRLELVFRLARDEKGLWQIRELRTGEAQWEDVETIAQAAKLDLQPNNCSRADEFGRVKADSALSIKRARCLVADLFTVTLPSDSVRIKELSAFNLGPQPSALAVSLVQVDFRLAKDSTGWRVVEFHSGNRAWVNLDSVPASINSLKRAKTTEQMNTIVAALEFFRKERSFFVISEQYSVLVDNLHPRYLTRVIRLDSWQHPYRYQGERDHFTLRSAGPDAKTNTADDIVVSRSTPQ
ncbi:MAG TPA: type II secretion system protein GspG [Pyrinomonadaceae bacterium]|nr:type II secretion system protein GspG [Pyrinomonadaceae bacterium]